MKEKYKWLKYAYPLGNLGYEGRWDEYWILHKKMRKDTWQVYRRVAFRIGAIKAWLSGDKWKP